MYDVRLCEINTKNSLACFMHTGPVTSQSEQYYTVTSVRLLFAI